MKHMRIICLLLAALLCLTGAALAEGTAATMNKARIAVTLGENEYRFPMSMAQCEAAGLTVSGDIPPAGCYNPAAEASDEGYVFSVRLDACGEDAWATGFTMKNNGAKIGDLQLGQTTREQAMGLMGAPVTDNGTTVTFEAGHGCYVWTLTFSGTDDGALLTGVSACSLAVARYGDVTGADAWTNEIDPTELTYEQVLLDGKVYQKGDLLQKLLDNGWKLPADRSEAVIPAANGVTMGEEIVLYNGNGFASVTVYNTADTDMPLAACAIACITVCVDDDVAFILPGGHQPGACSAEDFAHGMNPIAGVQYDVSDTALSVRWK